MGRLGGRPNDGARESKGNLINRQPLRGEVPRLGSTGVARESPDEHDQDGQPCSEYARQDSNLQPSVPKTDALSNCATGAALAKIRGFVLQCNSFHSPSTRPGPGGGESQAGSLSRHRLSTRGPSGRRELWGVVQVASVEPSDIMRPRPVRDVDRQSSSTGR